MHSEGTRRFPFILGLATRWLTLTDHHGRIGTPSFVRIFYCNCYIGVFLYYFWHLGEPRIRPDYFEKHFSAAYFFPLVTRYN